MYGGSPSGVELILHYYHELWAEIQERHKQYQEVRDEVSQKEGLGAGEFSTSFLINNPEASNKEVTQYVVQQWMKISEKLKIPINYSGISKDLNMDMP